MLRSWLKIFTIVLIVGGFIVALPGLLTTTIGKVFAVCWTGMAVAALLANVNQYKQRRRMRNLLKLEQGHRISRRKRVMQT